LFLEEEEKKYKQSFFVKVEALSPHDATAAAAAATAGMMTPLIYPQKPKRPVKSPATLKIGPLSGVCLF
jgi:hypothetical protein